MIAALTLSLLAASPAEARFLATDVIQAVKVAEPLVADASAGPWAKLPATTVVLSAQRTVHLNDRDANEVLEALPTTRSALVRAAYNDRDLAIVLEWRDDTEDRAPGDETNRFGDGAAMQLPLAFGAGQRLPYVGMGDESAPVMLYLQRAIAAGSLGRELVAAGFGSSTRSALGQARMAMKYDSASRRWRAVLVRPLQVAGHDLRTGLVPVAFALWDGGRHERGGNKALSSWKALRLAGLPVGTDILGELSWGYDGAGDLVKGKQLVETVCAACHRVGDKRSAPVGLAPPLHDMGVIATPAYLRDSIVAPGLVLVPGKGWSMTGADGKKVSTMPPFAGFPAGDIAAMVAYLRTLGVPADAAKAMLEGDDTLIVTGPSHGREP